MVGADAGRRQGQRQWDSLIPRNVVRSICGQRRKRITMNNSQHDTRAAGPAWPLYLALLALATAGLRTVTSSPYWMHLVSGRWIRENGIPRTDPFTLTQAGERGWI